MGNKLTDNVTDCGGIELLQPVEYGRLCGGIKPDGLDLERSPEESNSLIIVQSFVTNISAPKTMEEIDHRIIDCGCYSMDDILYGGSKTCWTVPRWAKIGDIVFFMHSKTSDQNLRYARAELQKGLDAGYDISESMIDLYNIWINRGLKLHSLYGGTIFAIGIVSGAPHIENTDPETRDVQHWKSNIYADVDHVTLLSYPIHISEFNDIVTISRASAITGVFGEAYTKLMKRILTKNDLPDCFRDKVVAEMPLTEISKTNWMSLTAEYRHAFFLEAQFRTYYVDYFLKEFGDQKTFYKECRVKRKGHRNDAIVDNLVKFGKKWLPVEVKLNRRNERDLSGQLRQYIHTDGIMADEKLLKKSELWNDHVLVIDTDDVCLYSAKEDRFVMEYSLLCLRNSDDIAELKKRVLQHLN